MLSQSGPLPDPEFGSLSEPEYCRNGTVDAFKLILVSLAGWMNRQQQHVIESLQEEIRVLKERDQKRRDPKGSRNIG